MKTISLLFVFLITTLGLLTSCGFHLQGSMHLASPFNRVYLQIPDPYGSLARNLQDSLRMSHVQLVCSEQEASIVLSVLQDISSEDLISVSSTQQTRQYNLRVTIVFSLSSPNGRVILPPQTLIENRIITMQSNQVLGNSNEANLYYQQMRRALAYAIMNRIASKEVSRIVLHSQET